MTEEKQRFLPEPDNRTFTSKDRMRVHAALRSYQRAHNLNDSEFARHMNEVYPQRNYDRRQLARFLNTENQPRDTIIRTYIEFLHATDYLESFSHRDLASLLPSFFLPESSYEMSWGRKQPVGFAYNPAAASEQLEGRYLVQNMSFEGQEHIPLSTLTLGPAPNGPFLQVEEDVFNLNGDPSYSMDITFPRHHFTGVALPIDWTGIFLLRHTLTRRPKLYMITYFQSLAVPPATYRIMHEYGFQARTFEYDFPNYHHIHRRVDCIRESKSRDIPRSASGAAPGKNSSDAGRHAVLARLERHAGMLLNGAYQAKETLVREGLDAGANVNTSEPFTGLNAFHLAVGTNNLDLARFLLLEAGAEIVTDKFGRWPSDIALETAADDDVIDFVLEAEQQSNARQ